jgi:iron complex outermembrane receptor protein
MLNKVTFNATLIALCTMLSAGAYAIADSPKRVDIPAGELSVALLKLSKQYGADLVYRPEQLHGLKTRGAHGSLTTEQAVTQLLQGTPLELRTDLSGAMLIAPPNVNPNLSSAGVSPPPTGEDSGKDGAKEGKKSSDTQTTTTDESVAQKKAEESVINTRNDARRTDLEEIIVTAQKRNERLQDVPVPVTAISADTLINNNQLRLQDYFTSVPGLSVTPGDLHGSPMLAIRGITTGGGFTNPTVGVVVDDVPYGSSTGNGGGFQAPDIDPSDLARVEVLRGPQGTLYGASSIGGLLKFVTVDPSTDQVSGHVQAGTNSVYNGVGAGYSFRGAVNVPLTDTLAVRASGYARQDPGYVDNVQTGQNGVNKADAQGGRLAALWRPADDFSIKLSALIQRTTVDGSPDVDLQSGLGDLQQSDLRGTGTYDTRFQAYSATVKAKLGSVDLISLSGYNINSYSDVYDFTPYFGSVTQSIFGITGSPLVDNNRTTKFTQEIRLSAPIGQKFEWLFGAFYTREKSEFVQVVLAENPVTGARVGTSLDATLPSTFEEYAVFTDVTYRVTDRFDVQIGGRESQNRQTFAETETGAVFSSPVIQPEARTKDDSFTYLVTPRFKVSPDLMVYARLASGYRPGGPNANSVAQGTPPSFQPDKTKNYEIGVKGDLLAHALSFDASLYYIDWNNIQVQLTLPPHGAGYTANAGGAKSQGVEFSVESRPLAGLTVAAWIAWDDAVLTKAFPPTSSAYGVSGDRLPYSSRFSGNLSVEQDFPLWSSVTGFVGGSVSYVGDRKGVFTSPPPTIPPRQDFPAYARTDVRTGLRYDSWMVNLFVNNVANKRGLLTGGLGTDFNPNAFNFIQPRTVGLSVSKTF